MMLMEFHDKDGNVILVNLAMFLYAELSPLGGMTNLVFMHGTTLQIKESPEEIRRSLTAMAMQASLKGH